MKPVLVTDDRLPAYKALLTYGDQATRAVLHAMSQNPDDFRMCKWARYLYVVYGKESDKILVIV